MFAKAQSPMKEHMVRLHFAPTNWHDYMSIVRQTELFFLIVSEVKEWMNKKMKWHEVGEIQKWEMLVGWIWGNGLIP